MALSSVPGVGAEAAKGQGFSAGRARPLSGTTPWSLAACQGPARHLPLPVSWEALTPHWTLSRSEPLVGGSRSPAPAVLAGVCRQPPEQRPLNDRPEVLGPGGSPTALRQDTHSHPRGGSGLMVTLRGIVHCSEPGTHPAPPSARLCTGGPAPEPQLCTREPPTGHRQGCSASGLGCGALPRLPGQAPGPLAGRGLQSGAAQGEPDKSKGRGPGRRGGGRLLLTAPLRRDQGRPSRCSRLSSGLAGGRSASGRSGAGPGPPCAGDRFDSAGRPGWGGAGGPCRPAVTYAEPGTST